MRITFDTPAAAPPLGSLRGTVALMGRIVSWLRSWLPSRSECPVEELNTRMLRDLGLQAEQLPRHRPDHTLLAMHGGAFLRAVSRLEVIDPLTLRVHTHQPAPDLLSNLTYIGVISRRAGEGATTADYNSGKAVVDTGPYRFVSFMPGEPSGTAPL